MGEKMKLKDLVPYLREPKKLDRLYAELGVDSDSESILIYMKNKITAESDLTLLPIEESEDEMQLRRDGVDFVQLFPVDHAIDLIESDLNLSKTKLSDNEVALRLIKYAQTDA